MTTSYASLMVMPLYSARYTWASPHALTSKVTCVWSEARVIHAGWKPKTLGVYRAKVMAETQGRCKDEGFLI